ncbi:Zinc finger, CCHC-type, partial [Sesbania bispinosa]
MCEPETIMRASPSPSTPPFKFNSTTPEISTLSPTLVKRMQGDTCYICNQQGHWSWYCPLNSPNNKPLSPSPNPNSTPPSQLNPSTPEISSLSPNVVERMQREKCYRCNQQGHWSRYCPLNSPDNKPLSPSPSPNHKMIPCRCGHGFWEVKTSHSSKNPDRNYYVCPIKRGARCKDFIQWCDDPIDESELQPPLFRYPECECGAGVCRRVLVTIESTNAVKYCFECPVEKGHGSCGYHVWEEVLNNNRAALREDLHDSSLKENIPMNVNAKEETLDKPFDLSLKEAMVVNAVMDTKVPLMVDTSPSLPYVSALGEDLNDSSLKGNIPLNVTAQEETLDKPLDFSSKEVMLVNVVVDTKVPAMVDTPISSMSSAS